MSIPTGEPTQHVMTGQANRGVTPTQGVTPVNVPYRDERDPNTGRVGPVVVDPSRSGKTMTELAQADKISQRNAQTAREKAASDAPITRERYRRFVVQPPGGTYVHNGVVVKMVPGKVISEQHYNIKRIEAYGIRLKPYDGVGTGDAETRFGY